MAKVIKYRTFVHCEPSNGTIYGIYHTAQPNVAARKVANKLLSKNNFNQQPVRIVLREVTRNVCQKHYFYRARRVTVVWPSITRSVIKLDKYLSVMDNCSLLFNKMASDAPLDRISSEKN